MTGVSGCKIAAAMAMTGAERSVLREGIWAGVIGAVVVAGWFFVLDIARGTPLLTPGLLGAAVFHGVNNPIGLAPSFLPILGYTVLHVLAFIAFGVIAASLIAVSEREPPMFVAVIILFAAFEVFFLAVVGAFGHSVLGALTWWAILVGNGLASTAMLLYFFRLHQALPATLVGSWGGVLTEGVMAGLWGAVAVAAWFFAVDLIQAEPFRTPALLGSAFLRQTSTIPAVALYTVFHGFAFVVFGVVASFLVAGAERQPMFVFALVILFTAFEVLFFGAIVIVASWLLDELAGWSIFLGNVLAAAAMLFYFFRRHRTLAQRLAHAWEED